MPYIIYPITPLYFFMLNKRLQNKCAVCTAITKYQLADLNDVLAERYLRAEAGVSGITALTNYVNKRILLAVLVEKDVRAARVFEHRGDDVVRVVNMMIKGRHVSPDDYSLVETLLAVVGTDVLALDRLMVSESGVEGHLLHCLGLSRDAITLSDGGFSMNALETLDITKKMIARLAERGVKRGFGGGAQFDYSIVVTCRSCGRRYPIEKLFEVGFKCECVS